MKNKDKNCTRRKQQTSQNSPRCMYMYVYICMNRTNASDATHTKTATVV